MQTVWNRAAQTRASCPSTTHAVKTSVARQTATAAGRRPTKHLTSATLLYSGIFAVAASTDALVKEKRRKQWDDAIARAKEGIEQVDRRTQGIPGNRAEDLVGLDGLLDLADAEFENPGDIRDGAIWPENTGRGFNLSSFAPQSIYASRKFQVTGSARALSPKKIQLTELAMDKMALRILLQVDEQDLRSIALDNYSGTFGQLLGRPHAELNQLLGWIDANIRATKSIDAQAEQEQFAPYRGLFSQYTRQVTEESLQNAAQLESNITWMFQKYQQGNINGTQLILNMLHNVTRSPSLPSLQCFNEILQGLSTSEMNGRMTEAVIKAMRLCHVRMNEESVIAILNHYRRTNNYNEFCKYAELIQGKHGGLWRARSDIRITRASQGRLIRVTRFGKEKIIQKMTPTPAVFDALVDGILHFHGFNAVLDICRSMGPEGWGLSIRGLTGLLQDCMRTGNWEGGLAVWEQIKAVQQRSRRNGYAERIQAGTFATMMKLCIVCDQQAQYEAICHEALASKVTIQRLLSQMQRLAEAKNAIKQTQLAHPVNSCGKSAFGDAIAARIQETEILRKNDVVGDAHVLRTENVERGLHNKEPLQIEENCLEDSEPSPQLAMKASHEQADFLHDDLGDCSMEAERRTELRASPSSDRLDASSDVAAVAAQQTPAASVDSRHHASVQYRQSRTVSSRTNQGRQSIHREQLMGMGKPSADLDIYEFTERPMSMVALGEESVYA